MRARDILRESPRSLPNGSAEKLLAFSELILRYRSSARLTSLHSQEEVLEVLILESLQLLPFLDPGEEATLADLGTGAGIPGIVLAIAEPALKLTLIERSSRKAAFLRIALAELDLHGAQVLEQDVGVLTAGTYTFDIVVSRGAIPLRRLLPLAGKLLAGGGRLLGFVSDAERKDFENHLTGGFQLDRMLRYHVRSGRSGFVYALNYAGETG